MVFHKASMILTHSALLLAQNNAYNLKISLYCACNWANTDLSSIHGLQNIAQIVTIVNL